MKIQINDQNEFELINKSGLKLGFCEKDNGAWLTITPKNGHLRKIEITEDGQIVEDLFTKVISDTKKARSQITNEEQKTNQEQNQ